MASAAIIRRRRRPLNETKNDRLASLCMCASGQFLNRKIVEKSTLRDAHIILPKVSCLKTALGNFKLYGRSTRKLISTKRDI